MKFPEECPACNKRMDERPPEGTYFFQRGEPDMDSNDPHRIVDEIMECGECHTLFRFRWKLDSIHQLNEIVVEFKEEMIRNDN